MKGSKILISFLIVGVAFSFVFLSNAFSDEFEIDDNGTISTFASKRGTSKPTMKSDQFVKKLPKGYSPVGMNFISFDKYQNKLTHIYNNDKAYPLQKYSFNIYNHKQNGEIYFYAFRVRNKRVKSLVKGSINAYEDGSYPSSDGWFTIGKKSRKETFYIFISDKPIKTLNKVRSVRTLKKLHSKFKKKKSYRALVTDEIEIEKGNFSEKIHSTMLGFKGVYSKRILVKVRRNP